MTNKPTLTAYWSQSVAEVSQRLRSTVNGLSSEMAGTGLVDYGPNVLQSKAKVTALGLFLNQFKSPIVLILIFATVISAFLRE